MQEYLIERDNVKWAQDRGWLVRKQSTPGHRGAHDRIFFKKSLTFTIEFKSTGKKATAQQRAEAVELRRACIPCRCIDNVTEGRDFIDLMTEAADSEDPTFDMIMLANDIGSFDE